MKQLLYEYIFSVILSLKYYIQSKGVHITMDIYVDADACPVVRIVETVAQKHGIPVTLLCDTNHVLNSDYSQIKVVGAGADAVDYKLISMSGGRYRCITGLRRGSHGSGKRCLCDPPIR